MPTADDDALAAIESDLATDQEFARRFTGAQTMLGGRAPSWSSIGLSALMLGMCFILLVLDVRLGLPWLLIPCVVIFAVAMRPVLRSMSGRSDPPAERWRADG